MNKSIFALLLTGLINAQDLGNNIEEGTVVEIDDGDNDEYTRKYSYDFSHLCPTQPTPAIKNC